jgi:V/A-type H+-transporting ATPase subunit I
MCAAFGIVYGELFGNLPKLFGWQTEVAPHQFSWFGVIPTFDRVAAVEIFMYVAIAVGVVHILFGLIMGVVNAVRMKHKKHVYEKVGILTFVLGMMVLAGAIAVIKTAIWVQLIVMVVALGGFVFAIRGGGVMGVVEIVESFAHMASYIRIMAVGLAGAIFADSVNGIVADMTEGKPGMIAVGILVGIILHALNFIIAAFSPTIHALRLNFLEFFGKFYETGKQQYRPFTKTGGEKSA